LSTENSYNFRTSYQVKFLSAKERPSVRTYHMSARFVNINERENTIVSDLMGNVERGRSSAFQHLVDSEGSINVAVWAAEKTETKN